MFISKGDFLGSNPTISIRTCSNNQTIFGGLLSLLVVLGTISSAFYFGREIWEKKNAIVNSSF